MGRLKDFLHSKGAKRFYWSILNSLMGLAMAFLAYLAGDNVAWAAAVLPVATGLSQSLTKYLNSK
jgi:hypothetical protein